MRLGSGLGFSKRGGLWVPSGSVNPSTIVTSQTLKGWWRGDLGVTVATGVSAWADQSGNGNHFAQGTAGAQPAYSAADATLNNQATLTFDGVDDEMSTALAHPAPGTTPAFWWLVFKQVTWTLNDTVIGTSVTQTRGLFQGAASPNMRMLNSTQVNQTSLALGSWARGELLFSNSTSDYMKLGATTTTGANAGNLSQSNLFIGSFAGLQFGNCAIAEFAVWFGGAPNAGELAALNAYATERYGGGLLV